LRELKKCFINWTTQLTYVGQATLEVKAEPQLIFLTTGLLSQFLVSH
jgi:hypothetical protein